jgi:hypothetical protein
MSVKLNDLGLSDEITRSLKENEEEINEALKKFFPDDPPEYGNTDACIKLYEVLDSVLFTEQPNEIEDGEVFQLEEACSGIKAKVFMKAFEELKKNTNNKDKFDHYYKQLQFMYELSFFTEHKESLTESKDIVKFRENFETFSTFFKDIKGIKTAKIFNHFIENKESYEEQALGTIIQENAEQAILAGEKTSREFRGQDREYLYKYEDINSILGAQLRKDENSLDGKVFQMEAQSIDTNNTENRALFKDALKRRIAEMNFPGKLVIPFNVGDNQWVGVTLEFDGYRNVSRAVLMDSSENKNERKNTINGILVDAIDGGVQLIDKPVTQQQNDYDGGPWTIHNLVENAKGNEPQDDRTTGRLIRADHQELVKDNGLSPAVPRYDDDILVSRSGKGRPGQLQSGTASSVKYNSQEYINLRLGLAEKMLVRFPLNEQLKQQVARSEPIIKMVDKALKKANGGKEFKEGEEIDLHKLSSLENHLSDQANDLMAQIGYESKKSYSFYADDMREQHGENKELAEQLTQPQFNNCFNKALNSFEKLDKIKKEKEESRWSRFKYGTIDAISGLKPKNWAPSTKIYAAAVAAILIPPPAGLLVAGYFAGKGCLESKTGKKIENGGKTILKGVGKVFSAVTAAVVGLSIVGAFVGSLPVTFVKSAKNKEWQWAIQPQAVVNKTKNVYNYTQKKIMGKPVGEIVTAIDKKSLSEVMCEAVKPRPAAVEQQVQQSVEVDLSQSQHKVEDRLDLAGADLKGLEGVTEAASVKQVTSYRSHEDSLKGQPRQTQRRNSIG